MAAHKKLVPISVAFPAEVAEQLLEIAEENGVSRSNLVREMVERSLAARKRKAKQ
ncbi:MAG: ribbon-helix-helix protein, CopG family [Hyphomicrobiaceae bacterium]